MKKHLGLIMGICAIVFCLLNVIGFFVPTISTKGDNPVKVSAMELAFYNEESATNKAKDLTSQMAKDIAAGNYKADSKKAESITKQIAKFTAIASIKANDDTKTDATFAGVMHFISMLVSVAVIVMAVLAIAKKNFVWTTRCLAIASFLVMLVSMIGYICFFTSSFKVGLVATKVSETYTVGAGLILSLIATLFACVPTFIPFKNKK